MTVSLNLHFETALKKREYWGAANTRAALSACRKRKDDSQIDWEEGDENWGRLMQHGQVILLVNARIPLAFVLSSHYDSFHDVLGDCIVVPIESFSSECFSVNSQLLEQVVGREVSSNVNYHQLSIDDLWWATV